MDNVGLSGTLTNKYVSMMLAGGGIGRRFLDGVISTGGCIDFYVVVEGRHIFFQDANPHVGLLFAPQQGGWANFSPKSTV
jgi:hypothetical protein